MIDVDNFRLSDTPEQVAVCGDWHGNTRWMQHAIYTAEMRGADVVVQLGDFGIGWDEGQYVEAVAAAVADTGVPVLFIDGNHENFDMLLALPVRDDGLREVAAGVFHLPRGLVWEWAGERWLAAGGGYSVDKPYRIEGVSWWPQETLTEAEVEACIAAGKIDVLLTHDTGTHVIPGTHRTAEWFQPEQIEISHAHRRQIDRIIEATRPALAFHGHYHTAYTAEVGETRVIGLDKDEAPSTHDHMRFLVPGELHV